MTTIDLVPFPGRSAGDQIRAYEPAEPTFVTLTSGHTHRIDVVQCFHDGRVYVEIVRQVADRGVHPSGHRDMRRGGRTTWRLELFLGRMEADDREALQAAISAAEMDHAMRTQMVTDPETGGPRDPAIGPHPRFREMDDHRTAALVPMGDPADEAALVRQREDEAAAIADDVAVSRETTIPIQGRHRVTDGDAYATRESGTIVFTLTQHGIRQLAEGLDTTTEHIEAVARRQGWRVEP